MLLRVTLLAILLPLAACQPGDRRSSASDEFMARLSEYCGQSFRGEIASDDAADDAWRAETVIVDIASCSEDKVRMPLHVGDDHSRVWVVTRGDDDRLILRHHHTHEDGTPDALTLYGGEAHEDSTASRQVFPADQPTKDLFDAENIPVSKTNVWSMEIHPRENLLAYELKRPERFFRVEFDLSQPVESPADPW